jgi:hypothetical protein
MVKARIAATVTAISFNGVAIDFLFVQFRSKLLPPKGSVDGLKEILAI